jgi:hypothetical protein
MTTRTRPRSVVRDTQHAALGRGDNHDLLASIPSPLTSLFGCRVRLRFRGAVAGGVAKDLCGFRTGPFVLGTTLRSCLVLGDGGALAIVEPAPQPPVQLAREASLGVGHDVVDLALLDRSITERMRAALIAHLDRAAQRTGEGALAANGNNAVGTVEHDPLDRRAAEIGDERSGCERRA